MSAAPTELNPLLYVFTQDCISGFALITPWALQGCRPCRALCRIGHLRCCVVVLRGDWCGRAMSPNGAILLHSPGRKPWVNHWNIFIEPQRGGTFLTNAKPQTANNDTEQQTANNDTEQQTQTTTPPNKSNN